MRPVYITHDYSLEKIEERVLVRETENFVWLLRPDGEKICLLKERADQYHATWKAARAHLVERVRQRITMDTARLNETKTALKKLRAMKDPT